VAAPLDVWPQFGGLQLTASSTALQSLTDSLLYLVNYPFECSEQIASRLLAIAALRDVLSAFHATGLPPPEAILASVKQGLQALAAMQNDDGGWGFWRRGEPSWPYLTIHVTHALARAKGKGMPVAPQMLERALSYLQNIEQHFTGEYSAEARRTLLAYALSVRKRLGDRDLGRARSLLADGGGPAKIDVEALGFIYGVLARDPASSELLRAIRSQLVNRAEESAGAAHFTTAYADGAQLLLRSDRRADAVLLEAMIADQPNSDLIPKLVTGLLAHRTEGRWDNTQDNAFALLALDAYFSAFEKVAPDFVARAWLDQDFAGEHRFAGRSTDRQQIEVPMSDVVRRARSQLVLDKSGAGRLYYRIGMQYAPRDLTPGASDHGFTVERRYEAIDAPDDVRRDPDGSWRIRAGARLRVRVTMVAQTRRYHVALVDPLPAGLEALNPALAISAAPPNDGADPLPTRHRSFWAPGPWFQHQNLRDERAEAFTPLLWEGVHEYAYIARATTPGVFIVPPAKAEEMYQPETFGRAAGDRVVIE
jgi:alpha-2-macroglobulin